MNLPSRSKQIPARHPATASSRQWLCALLCFTAIMSLGGRVANAQGVIPGGRTIAVSGGITVLDPGNNVRTIPNIFTWKSRVGVTGAGWPSNEVLTIHLLGPLTTPGVTPDDWLVENVSSPINEFRTRGDGTLGGVFVIPYDGTEGFGYSGDNFHGIPRPGRYEIYVNFGNPNANFRAVTEFDLSPDTIVNNNGVFGANWGGQRGGRDGAFGILSPERTDPEWVSVWSEEPVQVYATVAETDLQGGNQPAFISYQDWPGTHYGHDVNLKLVPDERYRWLLGTANFQGPASDADTGRIEFEWETQNAGNPFSIGKGNIGIPLWATPTAGDRIYTVGRWVMDNGHPDAGDRTEIHPARLLATIRKQNTAVPFQGAMTRASQVDIFVSGHGGGANQFPDGLSAALDNFGRGGARFQDVANNQDLTLYYQAGPANSGLTATIASAWNIVGGKQIHDTAGPSALGWTNGPEERPVNDMDYDFDVPLPTPPAGATSVQVLVATHPEHTSGVNEVITYIKPDLVSGLPTGAHIHLPYKGADSGIFARTFKFYWDQFSPPGEHFVVQINDVNNTNPDDGYNHLWYLWTDVCGQWISLDLTGLQPFFSTYGDKITGLDAAHFDVYLDAADPLRVFTVGYEVHAFDALYGFRSTDPGVNQTLFTAYQVANNVAEDVLSGDGDDADLGGALFSQGPDTISALVWPQNAAAQPVPVDGSSPPFSRFNVDFTVTHVDAARPRTTTTTLTSSKNPSIYGDSVTFTATVARTSKGVTPPTGALVITIDGSPVAATISSSYFAMTATYSTMALPATTLHTVTATYTNVDGNFGPSGPASLAQTVTQAPLTIRANNASKILNAPNPSLSATYSGFVNGDTSASLGGTLNCLTTATTTSPVGSYPITCSGRTSTNYAIAYVQGTLTIRRRRRR